MVATFFVLMTIALFFVPLIPSLVELITKSDSQPLKVVQDYDTDIRHFARSFKSYVQTNFDEFLSADAAPLKSKISQTKDGADFMFIKNGSRPFFEKKEINAARTSKLIVAQSSLVLTEPLLFETEVYSKGTVNTAADSHFRALYAEDSLTISENCTVLRWAHCNQFMHVKSGTHLYGRASSDLEMQIEPNCAFERVNAPKILFGQSHKTFLAPPVSTADLTVIEEFRHTKDQYGRRWLVGGNVKIDENHLFDGDLVSAKGLTIGNNSHIKGSIKSNRDMVLGDNVRIDGSIFSTGDLYIGRNCRILGPVIAERLISIDSGTVVGATDLQTTISAPKIELMDGVVAHGTVWADESGIVKA